MVELVSIALLETRAKPPPYAAAAPVAVQLDIVESLSVARPILSRSLL